MRAPCEHCQRVSATTRQQRHRDREAHLAAGGAHVDPAVSLAVIDVGRDLAVEGGALDCIAGTWRASLRNGVDALSPPRLHRFMLVIARRMAWDWRHHNRHFADTAAPDVDGGDPMPALEARAELRRVAKLVTPGDRRLLVALADGATFAEVGRAMRTPPGTLATRVRVARRRLRAAMRRSK
jgi:DNA-directed RNA polymerase specialized sigma24 family protein